MFDAALFVTLVAAISTVEVAKVLVVRASRIRR